ncbi:MAG: hypothetical protein ACP5PJ_01975 [Acidimicrobiales bacterium]
MYGPRSSTRQVVCAQPSLIVTIVPKGRDGDAQVPAGEGYQDTTPVLEATGGGGGGGLTTVTFFVGTTSFAGASTSEVTIWAADVTPIVGEMITPGFT